MQRFLHRIFRSFGRGKPGHTLPLAATALPATAPVPLVHDVFTVGGLPSFTYVSRDDLKLEEKIAAALSRGHSFSIVTGPTKSGKTTLCRKVLENRLHVRVEGAHIKSEADFWVHIAHQLNLASTVTRARSETVTATGSVGGTVGIPQVAQATASVALALADQTTASQGFSNVLVLASIRTLLDKNIALLVDDFHFIDGLVQTQIIRSLKSAVFDGLTAILLAVPHRAFDALIAEADIEGRTIPVSIPSWSIDDLSRITEQGFRALNVDVRARIQGLICEDSYGSPLLVQEICADFCERNGISSYADTPQTVDEELLADSYREIAERKASPKMARLKAGPDGGRVRVTLRLRGGGTEDLYTALLVSLARLGPEPATHYRDLRMSLKALLDEGTRMPTKAALTTALSHLSVIARDQIRGEPVLEWLAEQETLVITDPFLMFYLRFNFRDQGTPRLPSAGPALVTL